MWSRFNVKHTIKKQKLIDLCREWRTLWPNFYTTWKLKTKQDAPSFNCFALLPHILHESHTYVCVYREYAVYAIELSIHTTEVRKKIVLFLLHFNFIQFQISSKFHSTSTKWKVSSWIKMNAKSIKWKTFEKFLTKN